MWQAELIYPLGAVVVIGVPTWLISRWIRRSIKRDTHIPNRTHTVNGNIICSGNVCEQCSNRCKS